MKKRFYKKQNLSPNELLARNAVNELITQYVNIRKELGVSQHKLAELSGIKQPMIARIEHGYTMPRIDLIIKLLIPLGKKLVIVPLEYKE
jgi:transcriptional regulator with XRE-family HTH domain